jgi:hypothetical protein
MKKPTTLHILALVVCMFTGGLATYLLGQDLNWDLLNYHFYNPWALLHHRILFDIQPGGGGSYINPFLDLPNYLLRTHLRPVVAGTILGAVQGINGWLVFEITNNLLKSYVQRYDARFGVALAVGVLSLFGATSLSELGNSMGDNLTSLFILTALLLILLSFENFKRQAKSRYLRVGGYVFAGMATGLKLTSLAFVIPLFLGGLLIKGDHKLKIKENVLHILGFLSGVGVAAGYWYFVVWKAFGNPIFPYYNAVFKSPYFPNVNLQDKIWFPTNLFDQLFYPFTFIHLPTNPLRPDFRDPRLAVVFALVVAAGLYWLTQRFLIKTLPNIRMSRKEGAFWTFIVFSYLLWQVEFSYYRYLLPVELVSLTAITLAAYRVISNKRLATAALATLLCLITLYTIPYNWGRIPWQADNFGPDLRGQLSHVQGTVIMAPSNPLGFLVPYLPANTRAISVADFSNLTTKQKERIISTIREDKSRGKAFYGIETTNGNTDEQKHFMAAGFASGTCRPIHTYVGQYQYDGALNYEICELTAQ